MAEHFREPERRQQALLPADMMEWLPQDDIVHLIVEVVAMMDLSKFEAGYKLGGAGKAPFAPQQVGWASAHRRMLQPLASVSQFCSLDRPIDRIHTEPDTPGEARKRPVGWTCGQPVLDLIQSLFDQNHPSCLDLSPAVVAGSGRQSARGWPDGKPSGFVKCLAF